MELTSAEKVAPSLRIDLPPGFVGMPVTNDDKLNERLAWAVGAQVGGHVGKSAEEFGAYLMFMTATMKANGVRVFGRFAAGEKHGHLASLTLAVFPWPEADKELLAGRAGSVTDALVDVYKRKHPQAEVRRIQLPLGPAMAAAEVGEFHLPPEYTGRPMMEIRPQAKAEYQIPLPDSEGVIILSVIAESEVGWPAIAEAAYRVAGSLRLNEPDTPQEP